MVRHNITILVLALVLTGAPAHATWAAKGAWEPDTLQDLQGGYAWTDPETSPDLNVRRVYFNLFDGAGGAGGTTTTTTLNPNSALLEGAIQAHPYHPYALLGVWKDCNDDGFVGYGDQALLEYRVELLMEHDICPIQRFDPRTSGHLFHNDGQWVREFIPIGYDDVRSNAHGNHVDENPYNWNDTTAHVWADWGLPGDAPGTTCALAPAPYGTLRSTGGILRWSDCTTGHRVVQTISTAAHAAGREDLAFDDAPPDRPDQSGSPLNRPNPYGNAADAPVASIYDCTRPARNVAVSDPTDRGDGSGRLHQVEAGGIRINLTDDQGRFIHRDVREPRTPTADEAGSPAGTVDETEEGVTGDCDRNDGARHAAETPYTGAGALESPREPPSPNGRTSHDFAFQFNEGNREANPTHNVLGRGFRGGSTQAALLDHDAGTGAASSLGMWSATSVTTLSRTPWLSRDALGAETVTHITAYAYVSPLLMGASGLRTTGNMGLYGAEGCNRTPATFMCDSEDWWRNAAGDDTMPRDARLGAQPHNRLLPATTPETEIGVRVHQPYQFRDIDCYDQSIGILRDHDIHWGAITETACQRP